MERRDWKTSSEAVKIEEMDKYLQDDEILYILEQSESGSWSASSDDEESDISMLKNCLHLKCQILMMIAKT